MTSLEIIEKLISAKEYDLDCEMATQYGSQEIIDILEQDINNLQQIKQDLEVLKIFKNYISLSYIKNLISENEFSLNNFDWEIKDEEIIINRIKELKFLVEFLETNKVGVNNE